MKNYHYADKTITIRDQHSDDYYYWEVKPYEAGVKVSYIEDGEEKQVIEIASDEAAILIGRAMMEVANSLRESIARLNQ